MFLLNTFLGFFLFQLFDIFSRQKRSSASPQRFSLAFFLEDNWRKMLVSLLLSFTLSLITHLNWDSVTSVFSADWELSDLIFVLIGGAPEFVLQKMKRYWGFLQPEKVSGYNRKD